MLLISTTHQPASDIGYLLHKNPERSFTADASFGKIHVVYPEAENDRATVAVLLEVDAIQMVRRGRHAYGSLANYVNDRPYVASSFLSVAIAEVFGTAMSGKSKERPELAETAIPFEIRVPVLTCRAGVDRICRLFEPLGYEVEVNQTPLDEQFPEWGPSPYVDLTLRGTVVLRDALRHLYLLLPVLDAKKHYYLDKQEVDKILSKGEGWLSTHPERDWIIRSALGRKPSLVREALEQLSNAEESLEVESNTVDEVFVDPETVEAKPTPKQSLHRTRHQRVVEKVREFQPKTVIDLGCGEGGLLRDLIRVQGIDRIVGMDVSYFALEKASRLLRLEDAGPRIHERVQLIHGSLMYRDTRIEGFDLCTIVEVVEHLDMPRLSAFERVVFEYAKPKTVLLTTPNREYNAVYEIDRLRHDDHRFEWSRAQFLEWATKIGERFGYSLSVEGIGEEHPEYGCPSQMAVFRR